MPSSEYRNGKMVEIPDTVLYESGEHTGDVTNTLILRPGVTVTASGVLSGTVNVQSGATLNATGPVSGTVHVTAGADVTIFDQMGGPCTSRPAVGRTSRRGPWP